MTISGNGGRPVRVAIIGGGPGGMFAAWRLAAKAGPACQITIFEASDRLGGKVKTNELGDAGLYEAGVAEIYDYSRIGPDPLRVLIEDELGLKIRHIRGGACFIDGDYIPNVEGLASIFGHRARDTAVAFQRRCAALMTPSPARRSTMPIPGLASWLNKFLSVRRPTIWRSAIFARCCIAIFPGRRI